MTKASTKGNRGNFCKGLIEIDFGIWGIGFTLTLFNFYDEFSKVKIFIERLQNSNKKAIIPNNASFYRNIPLK